MPSITAFRGSLRSLIVREAHRSRPRDVVVLAVDGVPLGLARQCWPHAHIDAMRSVFPSTSSSAWLSCLTGLDVAEHGVPGVVFRLADVDALIHVFQHRGPLATPDAGNIFSDAKALGYLPVAVQGDWDPVDCTWRQHLLSHAKVLSGHRFYTMDPEPTPRRLVHAVRAAVEEARKLPSDGRPALVWCYIELDKRIHAFGYDDAVISALCELAALAARLAQQGAVVVAHSDHGLVPTHHDAAIAKTLAALSDRFHAPIGGAGRARWFHCAARDVAHLAEVLRQEIGDAVEVCPADAVFGAGTLSRRRVGEVVFWARGEAFVTFDGQTFEHGGRSATELDVPWAVWAD